MRTASYWACRACGHRQLEEDGPVCEDCGVDATHDSESDTAAVLLDAAQTPADAPLLEIHPDDILGNESVRSLCAHYLGQETPVTRATILKWRKIRGFPEPLACGRAGVELWDARQVRAWVQDHARERHGT